jgi:hypothetical protein
VANTKKIFDKIDYVVRHEPNLLPLLFKDKSIKKGLLQSRLKRVLPCRVGIEFELTGNLSADYIKDHPEIKTQNQFAHHFGVFSYSEDNFDKASSCYRTLNEIRVSVAHPNQLKGLYRIMESMKKYCSIPIGGGIHIHVDWSDYVSSMNKLAGIEYVNKHLDEVESIFPKYEGTYNKRRAYDGKASYVNFSYLNTLEFRIAPLTFEYETLIDWITNCCKFVSKMNRDCKFKRISDSKTKFPLYQDLSRFLLAADFRPIPISNATSSSGLYIQNTNMQYNNYTHNRYNEYEYEEFYRSNMLADSNSISTTPDGLDAIPGYTLDEYETISQLRALDQDSYLTRYTYGN